MLAVPYICFTSIGDDQSAFEAIAYHDFSGCSALDSRSQYSRIVRFAMIRTKRTVDIPIRDVKDDLRVQ